MKRVLPIIIMLAGVLILAYSVFMVSLGKSLTEPAGIVFTAIGLLILAAGIFINLRRSRPRKKTKCGSYQSIRHSFEKKSPCNLVCVICGVQEERHSFVKKRIAKKSVQNAARLKRPINGIPFIPMSIAEETYI